MDLTPSCILIMNIYLYINDAFKWGQMIEFHVNVSVKTACNSIYIVSAYAKTCVRAGIAGYKPHNGP